jgi:hypothetical protein
MARNRKTPVTKLPDIHVGDRVVITSKGPRHGQDDTVAEIDVKNGVRLQGFGWLKFADVEVLDSSGTALPLDAAAIAAQKTESEIKTQVDGKDAKVVLDGKTGGVAGDEPMIRPPLEDLVKSLARASETLAEATIAKKRANEAFNDADGAFNAVAHAIVNHYGSIEQLHLELAASQRAAPIPSVHAADVEDEEGDELEENDEETETIGAGARHSGGEEGRVRSYAGAEGPE